LSIRSLFVCLPVLATVVSCAGGGMTHGGGISEPAPRPDSLITAGMAAAEAGDYAGAKDMFDAALAVAPDNADAYRGLAQITSATGDPVSAVHYYEIVLELPDVQPQDYLELAGLLDSSGRGTDAIALLTDAAAANPDNAALHGELGSLLLESGETEKAIEQLRLAVDLGAGRSTHRKLADTLFDLQRFDEAEAALVSFDARYPDVFDINMKLAYIYFQRGEFKSALPRYRTAVTANPNSVDARVGLARTLESLGRIDNAIRVYDDILEMRGLTLEMEPIIISQANLLNKRGKYTRSLELLEDASERFPETPGLSCARGMALAGEARYEEAIAAFSRATGDPKWSQFANAQIRRIQSIRQGR
jgi:tetratricopeptide (TPR) repeat protein